MGRKALPTDEMNLTEREHRILDFMKKKTAERGYPPTVRELCEALCVKSTSTIHKDLSSLEKKGFIHRDPAKPRAIGIIGQDEAGSLSGSSDSTPPASDEKKTDSASGRSDVTDVPVIGQVAAGTPILARENITDMFPVPNRYIRDDEKYFVLTVKGESMIEAGILNGDYILVRQQNMAQNGQIVVAMVDGFESEATVKTFYRENDHIRLQPANSAMSPILVRDVKILGIVSGVFRYLS